jgi:mRNA interferase MazF
MELNQYEIVLVNLDPTIGSEIKKTRPCLIISPNEMNKFLQTLIIAPITSTSKAYPTRIEIKGKETKVDQCILCRCSIVALCFVRPVFL